MRTRLLVLDMDGTIADTDLLLVLSWLELYRRHAPGKKPSLSRIMEFSGPPIRDSLLEEFPDVDPNLSVKEFSEISGSLYEKWVTTYPGCIDALRSLKEKGVLLAVLTNKRQDLAEKVVRILGMDGLFSLVLGGGSVPPKPDPAGLLEVFSRLGVAPEEGFYMGDTEFDLLAARNARVPSILADWGPRRLPKGLSPDLRVSSYQELLEVLGA